MPAPVQSRQFSLRTLLIVVAWLSVLFAGAGYVFRASLVSAVIGVYLVITLIGALIGTVYGAVLKRPERNRWIRAFACSSLLGTAGFAALFIMPTGQRSIGLVLTGLMISTVPAVLAASLTEVLRHANERFHGK